MENEKKKKKRNGAFIGGYVPEAVKDSLERRAKAEFKTVTQVMKEILLVEFGYLPRIKKR